MQYKTKVLNCHMFTRGHEVLLPTDLIFYISITETLTTLKAVHYTDRHQRNTILASGNKVMSNFFSLFFQHEGDRGQDAVSEKYVGFILLSKIDVINKRVQGQYNLYFLAEKRRRFNVVLPLTPSCCISLYCELKS